ncbi:MAG: SIS domain-containing protein [Clostridia bacterium]|nr:SIS domain-containing protein [Clostridia bacterium]
MSIMLDEFLSAPEVVRNVATANKKVINDIAKEFKERNISNIATVARGTSDSAATYFKYIVETIGEIVVSKLSPSVTTVYGSKVNLKNSMVLAISQSGMSTDTIMVVRSAKETGALTVAVTNNPESELAKIADYHIDLHAGEEQSVAATKTYLAEMVSMFMLSNALSPVTAKMNVMELPAMLKNFIDVKSGELKAFAEETKELNNFIVLTRGLLQSVASELSLKMMETCYTLSNVFSTSQFMHGPISIVEEGTKIVLLAPDSEFRDEFIAMTTRLSLLGADVIAFTDIPEVARMAYKSFAMPTYRGMNLPFVYALATELYCAYIGEAKGINVDSPRNRKKVTITK